MITADTIYMRLQESWLCADCESIGSNARQCVACASEHGLLNLGTVLNRHSVSPEAKAVLQFIPSMRGAV